MDHKNKKVISFSEVVATDSNNIDGTWAEPKALVSFLSRDKKQGQWSKRALPAELIRRSPTGS